MKSGNTALVLKVLVAVAALVIAGTLAADVFGRFLDRPARSTLAGAGALVAFLSASAAAVGQWRSQRAESHREAAGVRLRALGWSVYDLTGIDVRDLGLAMYVVRPSPVRRWRPLLRRVAYERSRRAVTTGVQWRPGMGVIGQCVASGERAGQDVGIDEEPYLDLVVRTRSEYESQVPAHVRLGLSRQEWLAASPSCGPRTSRTRSRRRPVTSRHPAGDRVVSEAHLDVQEHTMSNDTPAVRLGGSMRRAPVRGPDPDSRGAKAYVRALRRLGVQPASAEKPERRRPS